ncbi:MAG TPA: serine/threonine-protein kinase [Polyangium sp.]|nr:serine/threonine-protein kinase [Polyangium sp.]
MDGSTATKGPEANILGKYRLIAELGHGGMAEVYLAVVQGPAGFNKLVVIKQIRPQLATDPEFLSMFLDEARLAARLSHPNVVQTNEVGQEGDRYFIAMEYLEGQPLNRVLHRIGRDGGLTLSMHLRIIIDMLVGLHHAHELTDFDGTPLNVVHRDVTPHNVFVTYDGQVKVVDFGIAKAMNSSAETRLGVVKGKVAYMAPEQARGERVDRRADIFSAGVMLWEAATGRRLWKGIPDLTVLHRLINGDIPSPRDIDPEVPEALEKIVMKALALRREDRYSTTVELATALEEMLDSTNDKTSLREVGKLVARHFEENRAKIKGIVETQLKVVKSLPTTEFQAISLPQLDNPGGAASGPMSQIDPSATTGDTKSSPKPASANSSQATTSSPTSLTASTPSMHSGSQPSAPPKRGGILGAVALIAAAAIGAGIWFATRPPAQPTNVATNSPQTGQVEIWINVSPANAKLTIDGKPLEKNPFVGKFDRDGASHMLQAEAPGYATRSRDITFDKDRNIEFALVPQAAAPGTTAPPPATSSAAGEPTKEKTKVIIVAPPTTEDTTKAGTKKPPRPIEEKNPYQ